MSHYFIPRFNLLSVKLTPAAQRELLQLFDIIIVSDIGILKNCRTIQKYKIWSHFIQVIGSENTQNYLMCYAKKLPALINDECLRYHFESLNDVIDLCVYTGGISLGKVIDQIVSLVFKTPLQTFLLKKYLFGIRINSLMQSHISVNKCRYQLQRVAKNEGCSFDISTCKLWCAILLYMKEDYPSTLDIINQVISSIPPFAMYRNTSSDTQNLYEEIFIDSDMTINEKARITWLSACSLSRECLLPLFL